MQAYIANEIREIYQLQGVKINDKHIEVIVRQMMRKVQIIDSGDTIFLPNQIVDKFSFREENDKVLDHRVITNIGDSNTMKVGQLISARRLREENATLKRQDLKPVKARNAEPAIAKPTLRGITKAATGTSSFISAASFQETIKVLSEAAILGKRDPLVGLKENVILGGLIPAGTGLEKYQKLIVSSKEEYDELMAEKNLSSEKSLPISTEKSEKI